AARIYRAALFVERRQLDSASPEAMAGAEVVPLRAEPRPGGPLALAATPLPVAGPACDHFDASAVVRAWVARPGTNHGLAVKRLPGWIAQRTALEIAYEGTVTKVPTQVRGLCVLHHAGQTFITWQEVDPLIKTERVSWGQVKAKAAEAARAYHYRIYVHDRPIDARSVAGAKLLARVGPMSGYNLNGRWAEWAIGEALKQPRHLGELAGQAVESWGMDHPRMDDCPVRRFVIFRRLGRSDRPGRPRLGTYRLPVGTGLYVHQPTSPGRRYYAVVSCLDGTENTLDFSPANSLAEPVAERVGPGEPVCQGQGLCGPFFDYPGQRKVYVQWAAPPLAPRPNMYFNWTVLVPPGLKGRVPAELYFHRWGRSCAKPARKLLAWSVQIAPHDYPFSGWYGYNPAAGTLRPARAGSVGDHTQRRIAAFMAWAGRAFHIDPERVFAVGWDGAVLTALYQPELFAGVFVLGFEAKVLEAGWAGRFAAAWGPKSGAICDSRGGANWAWADLEGLVLARRAVALPLFVCRGYSWGRFSTSWGRGRGRFYRAMHQARQPIFADWSWGGGRLIAPDRHSGLWRGVELTRATAVLALSNSTLDADGESDGQTNAAYSWKDMKDGPDEFAVTLLNNSSRQGRVDVTPRRLRWFKLAGGQEVVWEARNVPIGPKPVTTVPVRRGRARADRTGLFTLAGLTIPGRSALVITVRRTRCGR
ncbi:MAG: hypothetical protein B1H04_03885, partial [Planctomycetales bacterium 4484_123]